MFGFGDLVRSDIVIDRRDALFFESGIQSGAPQSRYLHQKFDVQVGAMQIVLDKGTDGDSGIVRNELCGGGEGGDK